MSPALAIDLDGVIADTKPLWRAWLESAATVLGFAPEELPSERGAAARELDERGLGNWRTLLERFAEEHAPVHLRRDPTVGAALRELGEAGVVLGAYTDAPEPLARVVLAQLGADRRLVAVETGAGALERLVDRLGGDAEVVRTRDELIGRTAPRAAS